MTAPAAARSRTSDASASFALRLRNRPRATSISCSTCSARSWEYPIGCDHGSRGCGHPDLLAARAEVPGEGRSVAVTGGAQRDADAQILVAAVEEDRPMPGRGQPRA